MRLQYPDFLQAIQTTVGQCLGNTLITVGLSHKYMLQVTTTAIMSAHGATNYATFVFSQETQIWVTLQIAYS